MAVVPPMTQEKLAPGTLLLVSQPHPSELAEVW
jgi:hypothetical protein